MYFEEVKYYLTTPLVGRTLLGTPPMGWNEDNKELVRSTTNWGVFTQLSNSLEFVNDGAEILNSTYEALGTEAEVILERVLLTQLNGEELDYRGHLDLKTYVNENDRVKVEFLTGGLQSLIESQFNEEFEIDRETDINGNEIEPIEYKKIEWSGRKIFLETIFETTEDVINSGEIVVNDPVTQFSILSLPMTLNAQSDLQFESTSNSFEWFVTAFQAGIDVEPPGGAIFLFAQRSFIMNISIDFSCNVVRNDPFNSDVTCFVYLQILRYIENVSTGVLELQQRFQIGTAEFNLPFQGIQNTSLSTLFEANNQELNNFQVNEGDHFAMGFSLFRVGGVGIGADIENIEVKATFNEDSVFPTTDFNTIRVHDVGERLMQILSGNKNRFKSQFFGKQSDGYSINSEFEKTTISSGEVIRNIPDGKITISLKDVFELNNYFNLGWGVERFGAIEKMVIEPKEYFFQNKVGIELGEVSNFKISVADELLYKSLGFGNDKAGDYEEIQGRSEYNTYNTFTTPLKTADDEYDVSGKVRADLIGAELARRKQYDENPNEDTRYDKENFIFSVKDTSSTLIELRTWQDDFESEPIVYDPNSAGNLLLTPFRSMQRHANLFKSGMIPYSLDFIRYASTKGNSNVATQLPDEPERFENGDIILNELKPPIFKSEYYEFSYPTTHEIRKRLMEKIDSIPVPYFLITFTFREQTYSGWLINVSLNNESNWKLIKNYK